MASATARFSSTTGEGARSAKASYRAAMRPQSVCSALRARAWQAGGDRRLQAVGAEPALGGGALIGLVQGGQAALDQQVIPAGAVLFQQQDRLAARADPGRTARGLDFHQRHQAVHLGFLRHQLGQDAAQAQGFVAQGRAQPGIAGRGGIAFVED
jgi:hypothetical protein